jgi:DNA-binding CsgD family transcriptional regulator
MKRVTRQVFLEILDKQLFAALFCISVAYLISWFIVIKLGFLVLNVKVSIQKIIPLIIIGSIYSFWAKQLLPLLIVGIGIPILVAFLLWITTRVHPFRAGWVALLILLSTGVGELIQGVLCSVIPGATFFLLQSAWGYVAGTVIETIGPLLALVILPKIIPKLKNPILPPIGMKPDRIDFTAFIIYFTMYSASYIASIVLCISLINGYQYIFLFLVFLLVMVITTILGYFRMVNIMQKKFELQISGLEEEKAELEANKAKLEAEKANLELEKGELIKKVRKLSSMNNMEIALKSEQFDAIVNDFIDKINNIKNPLTKPANGQVIDQAESDLVLKPIKWAKYHITPREKLILEGVVAGKTNQQIGDDTYYVEGTIKNILTDLFRRFKVRDRAELARFVIENELIDKR